MFCQLPRKRQFLYTKGKHTVRYYSPHSFPNTEHLCSQPTLNNAIFTYRYWHCSVIVRQNFFAHGTRSIKLLWWRLRQAWYCRSRRCARIVLCNRHFVHNPSQSKVADLSKSNEFEHERGWKEVIRKKAKFLKIMDVVLDINDISPPSAP